jgi:hypothetical protein
MRNLLPTFRTRRIAAPKRKKVAKARKTTRKKKVAKAPQKTTRKAPTFRFLGGPDREVRYVPPPVYLDKSAINSAPSTQAGMGILRAVQHTFGL